MKMFSKIWWNNYFLLTTFLVFGFVACKEEKIPEQYVAKVNGSLLTESDLHNALNSGFYETKHKNEYIRRWVETELLYQEAVNNDILQRPDYIEVLKQSKKQLAAAYLLNDRFDDGETDFSTRELKSYFNKYINDFKIFDDAFILNIAEFNDENKALLFRYTLIENNWNTAYAGVKNDDALIDAKSRRFIYKYQLKPVMLYKAVKNLLPDETSIVLQTEPGVFTVVQLITFLEKNSFPEFEYVKELVQERFRATKRAVQYKEFIDELFLKYNVKIKKEIE